MSDLLVTVGTDATQYNRGMQQVAQTAQATSNSVTRSLAQAAASAQQSGTAIARASNTAGFALTNLGRVAQDAPFGFIGIQNNINPLLESFQRLRTETGSASGAFRALAGSLVGAGGLGLAVSLVTAGLTLFFQHQQKVNAELKAQKKAIDDVNESSIKEITTLSSLYEASQNVNLSHSERLAAVNELQKQYPAYFKNLSDESVLAGKAQNAYDNLTQSILNQAVVRAAQSRISDLSKPLVDLIVQEKTAQAAYDKANSDFFKKTGRSLAPNTTDILIDQSTASNTGQGAFSGKTQSDLQSLAAYKKTITDKVNEAKAGLQQILQDFGINSLIDPNKEKQKADKSQKTLIEQLEAQLKALQDEENKWIEAGNKQDFFNLTARERNINSIIAKIEQLKQADAGVNAPVLGQAGKQPIDLGVPQQFGSAEDLTAMQNTVKALNASNEARGKAISDQIKFAESIKVTTQVSRVFGQGLTQAFQSVLSGGQSFVSAMGQFLGELITRLIAAAAAAALLAVILSAVGFGSGFAGAATEAGSFKNLFGSFSGLKLANGGITQGPTQALIGEGKEAEAVMPLSKLDQFVNNNQGNGFKDGQIVGVLRGQNMLLQYKRATKSQNRLS